MRFVIPVAHQIKLRELAHDDAEDIFNAINTQRDYLGKWLPFVPLTQTVDDTMLFVDAVMAAGDTQKTFTIRHNNEFIGLAGLKEIDLMNRKAEIGYWLSASWQGKGIMTQSVHELCEYGFSLLGLHRIQIRCAVGNTPSRNIPLRLGFTLEGIQREAERNADGSYLDLEVFSKLETD